MLIIIMGLPGTGKTTFARALAKYTGAIHLNSDHIRTMMDKRGAYAPEDKKAVYDELLHQTEICLQQGRDVIVDSTFYMKSIRTPYYLMAEKYDLAIKVIMLMAGEATLKKRLAQPRPDSEADFNVYKKIKAAYEPPEVPYLELWSDQMSMDEMLLTTTLALE